jgi:hypothetical protein
MEIWAFIFLSCVVLNLSVSILIVKRADLDSFQKAAQIALVWIIPVIAPIGLWLFHRSNDDNNPGGGPIGGGPNNSIAVHVGGD